MKYEANLANIHNVEPNFTNTDNFRAYVNTCIKPVVDQYNELNKEEDYNIDLTKGKVILFDNEDEMYNYLHENGYDTDKNNDGERLFEDISETDEYKEFIYILNDSGDPESGIAVAYIK